MYCKRMAFVVDVGATVSSVFRGLFTVFSESGVAGILLLVVICTALLHASIAVIAKQIERYLRL